MPDIRLPDIPGIVARRWAGDHDYATVADLVNAEAGSFGPGYLTTPEDVRVSFESSSNMDLEDDFRFVEAGGSPLGYVIVRWWQEEGGPRVYRHMCKVHPDWLQRGIGTALLAWAQERLREVGAGHTRCACDRIFRTDVDHTGSPAGLLLESFGYRPTQHHAELVRPHLDDVPDAALPEGVELRPVEPGHLRAIFEADAEANRDHWGYVAPTDKDWRAFLDFPYTDHSLWKIAWTGDRVVGQVRGFVNEAENEEFGRKRGWCEFISTDRARRGRGVATALISATLREFRERGLEEAALGVHIENPNKAFRLYRRLGFEITSQGATYERPV
jgi:ribosomal protein S18 acetylase RimI-like enzyme